MKIKPALSEPAGYATLYTHWTLICRDLFETHPVRLAGRIDPLEADITQQIFDWYRGGDRHDSIII